MSYFHPSRSVTIRIIGYCEYNEDSLLRRYLIDGAQCLLNLRGEYTLVIEEHRDGHSDLHLVTSPVGGMHYFFLRYRGRIFHGDKILDILKSSGLAWKWNWSALGDLWSA